LRRSRAWIAVAAALLAAAVVPPAALLARAASADVSVAVAPVSGPATQVALAAEGRLGRIVLAVTPPQRTEQELRYAVRVAVPRARSVGLFVVELRADDAAPIGRCVRQQRPDRHTRLVELDCPFAQPRRLRWALLEAQVPGGVPHVSVRRRADGLYEGGAVLAVQPGGPTAALERLAVGRPAAFGGLTLLIALGLSTGLLAALLRGHVRRAGDAPRRPR
jgi:hypothetical protein